MPMPVSRTEKRSVTRSSAETSVRTVTTTISPLSVNLTALVQRLMSTCSSRSGSPTSRAGTSGAVFISSSRPFCCAFRPTMAVTRSNTPCRLNSRCSSSSLPASTFEKSRMSLRMASSESAAARAFCR